jgi:hypothetical protein
MNGSLFRARGFFITLLMSRLGSSMKKSFAFGEAVGLTPFGPRDPAARRGETALCPREAPRGAEPVNEWGTLLKKLPVW